MPTTPVLKTGDRVLAFVIGADTWIAWVAAGAAASASACVSAVAAMGVHSLSAGMELCSGVLDLGEL